MNLDSWGSRLFCFSIVGEKLPHYYLENFSVKNIFLHEKLESAIPTFSKVPKWRTGLTFCKGRCFGTKAKPQKVSFAFLKVLQFFVSKRVNTKTSHRQQCMSKALCGFFEPISRGWCSLSSINNVHRVNKTRVDTGLFEVMSIIWCPWYHRAIILFEKYLWVRN